jgi:DNA-binding GntR family transcriptional regulator
VPDPLTGFRLRRDDAEPLHAQVSAHLRALILGGSLAPRAQLPAEPELAARLGVSRGTLRRAITTLLDERLVVQHHGRGTFVTAGSDVEAPFVHEITSLAQSFSLRGVPSTTRVRTLDHRPAEPRAAAALQVASGDRVLHLDRIRSDADGPAMRLVNVMRTDVVVLPDPSVLTDRALYDVFEELGLPPAAAVRTFEASAADGELAALLEVTVGHPILHIEQLTSLADGRPLEYSDVWIRGDRLKLQVHVRRGAT